MQERKTKLFFIILFFSCGITFAQKVQNPSSKIILKPSSKLTKFDSSFIGQTTDDKYIEKLFECWGTLISEDNIEKDDSLAICGIAPKIEKCNVGKFKILFEKMLFRNEKGKAVFAITDELIFINKNPKIKVSLVDLQLKKDKKPTTYLVKFIDNRKPYVENFLSIWEVDFKKLKFIPIKILQKVRFHNPDYDEE